MIDDNDSIDFKIKESWRPIPKVKESKDTPTITLYIGKEKKHQLTLLAKQENRSISKQVIHMFEYYCKHKK